MTGAAPHFTEATTAYWQQILPADAAGPAHAEDGLWRYGYPARLPDGRVLMLPIRQLATEPAHAVASLICNQAALDVIDTLAGMIAERLAPLQPEVVVAVPTLGLSFAPVVARRLGLPRMVPLGYSCKFRAAMCA